eukprot:m.421351 g.421351  ORF g.421351 m.421351 type:complete len:72 (-) comp16846_c3_seq3:1642-1857(-)
MCYRDLNFQRKSRFVDEWYRSRRFGERDASKTRRLFALPSSTPVTALPPSTGPRDLLLPVGKEHNRTIRRE